MKRKHQTQPKEIQTVYAIQKAPMASSGYVDKHSNEVGKQLVVLLDLVGPNSRYGFDYKPWSRSPKIPIGRAYIHWHPPSWIKVEVNVPSHGNNGSIAMVAIWHSQLEFHLEEGNRFASVGLRSVLGVFAAWSLSLFQYYAIHLRAPLLSNDNLILNFTNSIFSASTFNFRPKTITIKHMDSGNLLFGWCTIPVLSWFNSKKGIHLILWDLKLVIEFPPGSTVLIPSTVL
ncbi:hypothetical protein EDD18DRAFT_1099087 [Armillaria luteobubalina]|uniref:Uncharacterized protein n=1 Tax=Armillaria luteobubalina TaxID=153913 RepID=A0AA39QK07_9AGAR|nr:hypothetical protein EDD18DRAFT_1099087 [Armillaria luteobubalina]